MAMGILRSIPSFLKPSFARRAAPATENLTLRHQLAVLQRSINRPKLRRRDRIFWVWLSRIRKDWRSALVIIEPKTVVKWHRQGFKLYWRWKSCPSRKFRPPCRQRTRDIAVSPPRP